ncbi:MAG: hypothetical protein ABIG08_03535 [bacterium]
MFKKLKEVAEGRTDLLTVRSTRVWLKRISEPSLCVEIDEEMEVLTNSRERRQHFHAASPWLKSQMEKWEKRGADSVRVGRQAQPLEVIAGDVALVLNIAGKRYLVSFFRDIDPVGWLVAGGCPRSLKEILDVKSLAIREGGEEIIIADQNDKIYQIFPLREELEENIRVLNLNVKEIVEAPAREIPPAEGDAQNLEVSFNGRETEIKRVNVNVDYEIASVAVTFYYEVELPVAFEELRIFDGELLPGRTPIHRAVQLTDENGNQVAIFSRGHNILAAGGGKPKWNTEDERKRAVIPKLSI